MEHAGPMWPHCLARASIALLPVLSAATCRQVDLSGSSFVTMADNVFSPAQIRVPAGGHVHFRNWGGIVHNAVAVDGSWTTDSTGRSQVRVGEWVDMKFDTPGVYRYYCRFHGTPDGTKGMVGTVIVGDAEYAETEETGKLAPVEQATGVTRLVPKDYPDIQTAVDAAQPGDLVLVSDGVYREEVIVTTPSITLRGTDRNAVILDGEFERANGVAVYADGVALENMTAQNYTLNGFFITGVTGYRGSYITAINNGDYGIYAFDSYNGVLEHSLGSGSPDAGFYVGGCYPCKTILDQVIGEGNLGGGYSGTNAGGELYIINSIWRKNFGGGIAPNTFDVEPHAPQRENVIVGNTIVDNRGNGVSIDGGSRNLVTRNYISGNSRNGIMVHATKDRNYYPATDNTIRDNVVIGSGRADLAMSGLGNIGNCFANNVHRTTIPWGLELLQRCDGIRVPVVGDMNAYLGSRAGRNNLFSPRASFGDEYKRMPHPAPQPQMPGGAGAPVRPAVKPFEAFPLDVDRITLPSAPEGSVVASARRP